jgi:hypothetical protein
MACCPRRSGRPRDGTVAICAASDDRTPILIRINVFLLFVMMAVVMVVAVVVVAIMVMIMVMVMIMLVIVVIFVVVVTDMAIMLDVHLILIQIFSILTILVVYWQTGRRWVRWERNCLGCFLRESGTQRAFGKRADDSIGINRRGHVRG